MNDLHHLRPLRAVGHTTPGRSLEFSLMAAVKHAENGEGPAMLTALADVIWLQHTGRHEQVSDNRMVTLLRSFGGMDWTPPEPDSDQAA